MMSKVQKTWLWVLGAMFVVPEVLWGDLIGILRTPFLPIYGNAQIFTDNPGIAYLVIIVEIIGVVGLVFLNNKHSRNVRLKYLFNIILVLVLILLVISFFLSYSVNNMHLL